LNIKEILLTEKLDECWDLVEEHRQELATYQEHMILKPDRVRYKHLEETGCLRTLALYDDEDKMVGYSATIFTNSLHYSDLPIAQNDVIYVRYDLRKGRWGLKLIQDTEQMCKDLFKGRPFLMLWHAKEDTAFAKLMPKLDYRVQDIIYSKIL
jgi:hypothetical protein